MPVVRPIAVWVLIALNALVYIAVQFFMSETQAFDFYSALWNNQTAVLVEGDYHRLLTSMFLHSYVQPFHIVFNMYALYAIGITVERFFGHVRFLLIYFLSGLAGSVLSILLNPPSVTAVGASGAVFGIFGAEMVFLYNHRKLFGQMASNQLRQLAIVALLNLAIGFFSTLTAGAGGAAIDNWAHIGGFVGGAVLAWFIGPILIPRKHPTQDNALTIEDINPLENRTQPLFIYASVLLSALVVGTILAR